jgi:lysophospholipase L1-like esterase
MRWFLKTLTMCAMATVLTGAAAASPDPALRAQLEQLAQRRVFFAHQSVGGNLIEGLQSLARDNGVTLQVRDVARDPNVPNQTFGHVFVGENGKPLAKLDEYKDRLAKQRSTPPDLAMVKLCFLDFTADTDPKAVFARYQADLAALRSQLPTTRFVHVTTPLTTIETGPKAWLKRVLGRSPYGVVENQKREQYNQLMRSAYAGREPLFDLAKLESTGEDGSKTLTTSGDTQTAALTAAYTSDGSHLNPHGERIAARGLAGVLAQALASPPATH